MKRTKLNNVMKITGIVAVFFFFTKTGSMLNLGNLGNNLNDQSPE